MVRKGAIAMVLAATVWTAGCLEKETTHTLYLSPGGAVAWTALERNVRSDSTRAASAAEEEGTYLAAALAGMGDVAKGFAALEATRVQTRVLRRERPFTVMTEARFPDVEVMATRILAELGLSGSAYTTREGAAVTLHVLLDLRAESEDGDAKKGDTAVMALAEDVDRYRIVMTSGRFTAAQGFKLSDDGTVATPIAVPEEEVKAKGVLELSLSWNR